MASFCDLNDDCLREIFKNVYKYDILSLLKVSQRIRTVAFQCIPEFIFNKADITCGILKRFKRREAIEIIRAIQRLDLIINLNVGINIRSYAVLTKNLKRLRELNVLYDFPYSELHAYYGTRRGKYIEKAESFMLEFLRQVRNLRRVSFKGLELDTETAEIFVNNNPTIEYVKIVNCKGIQFITKLPKVRTVHYVDDGLGCGLHIKIAQMESLGTLIYDTSRCNYKIKDVVDQLAITNVVRNIYLIIREEYYPSFNLNQIEFPKKMTSVKRFSLLQYKKVNHRSSEIKINVKNLPELEYMEYTCSLVGVNEVLKWLSDCPLLKELKCVDLIGVAEAYDDGIEIYLQIENYLALNNRSLTLSLTCYEEIPPELKSKKTFKHLKFRAI